MERGLSLTHSDVCVRACIQFAVDENNFYKSDYAAAKVAGHELKGVLSYFNCKFTGTRRSLAT